MATKLRPLAIRKLADRSEGERVRRFDPVTGNAYLADPDTWQLEDASTWVAKPWPLAGIRIEGEAPKETCVATSFVTKGQAEGWLTVENPRMIHRPGGPNEEPWRITHTFQHADAVVLHTVDGDVRYLVVDQPDKWPAEKNELDEGWGGEVRWFYRLRLDS